MGFGFNLFFIFLLLPFSAVLLLLMPLTKVAGKILLYIWTGVLLLVLLSFIVQFFRDKTILDKDDFYGSYIIDRTYFPGKQADWQYEHFRFEIKDNDSIFFYVTNKEKILHVYKGTVSILHHYESKRLAVSMDTPTHHILTTNPTIYRSTWSFHLVFNSPKFSNMYFRKGSWKPL